MQKIKSTSLSYSEVGMLSKLTRDYLDDKPEVKDFFGSPSKETSVIGQIQRKSNFPVSARNTLVNVLLEQYSELESKKVFNNIRALGQSNTYTITTGHQLNLFTGPVYFVYKIVSAIKTAERLNRQFPNYQFVPVYWMATEDHDFDEINHAYVDGKKMVWNSDQQGMVGEFRLEGLEEVVEQFCAALGNSVSADKWKEVIRKSYLGHKNLADATRQLVHEIFKDFGLVIVDGNHKDLKKQFSGVVQQELTEQCSFANVSQTISSFGKDYGVQVNPREINLFYAEPGSRERIVFENGQFRINNRELEFSLSEILSELESNPEKFSPNVILRPVYQEVILPNLVYIGGGAEVAYWLQLKPTFDSFQIPYPLVQIRSSFLVLDQNTSKRMNDLNLTVNDLYTKKEMLVQKFTNQSNPWEDRVQELEKELIQILENVKPEMVAYDSNLEKSVNASQKMVEHSIKRLSKKLNASVRRVNEETFTKLESVWDQVYPMGVYQERRMNFFELAQIFGDPFLKFIEEETEPFCSDFRVIQF